MAQNVQTFQNGPKRLSAAQYTGWRADGPNASNVRDASGRLLTLDEARAGGPRIIPGWNTGGVGSGSYGHRGYGGEGGQVLRIGKGSPNHGRTPPAASLLNEFYRNQPGVTMSPWEEMQQQKKMDRADPVAAHDQNLAAVAHGQGQYDKAGTFHQALQDRVAQKNAAGSAAGRLTRQNADGSTSSVPDWSREGQPQEMQDQPPNEYHAPGERRFNSAGDLFQWNQNSGRGDLIQKGPVAADVTQPPDSTWSAGNNLGEGSLSTPYGGASVAQDEIPTTFTNGQGSSLGGVQFPGRRGTQSAADFFQGAANRQGDWNARYAAPEPGYGGTFDESFTSPTSPMKSPSWSSFHSAMATKNKLGKR